VQGEPRSDRDWEHWPGRRQPDDRIRHRLKSLFTPTEHAADDVEALIAERGRELEERTRQLAATIADLERREESTRRLRIAVEEMLRRGSAELDDRHAELNALAVELTERDARLAAAEHELEERRRELGAVELLRAAVERRESSTQDRETAIESAAAELAARRRELETVAAEMETRLVRSTELEHALAAERETLDARQATLTDAVGELESRVRGLSAAEAALVQRETRVADLEERSRELALREEALEAVALPGDQPTAAGDEPTAHLLLLPGDRYRLEERVGPLPVAGSSIETDWGTFRVLRVGPSPYPSDPRRCAYLEPAPPAEAT
jgi:chromosome segregation ATPase